MTNEDLIRFSGEHLFHEFKMFWWLSAVIAYMGGPMSDALVESWVVHLRNLILFFCCHDKREPGDVIAQDFFNEPGAWLQIESEKLTKARLRANKEISHITEQRKYIGDKEKDWDVAGLFKEIEKIAHRFATTASPAKLHAEVRRLLTSPEEIMIMVGEQRTNTIIQMR